MLVKTGEIVTFDVEVIKEMELVKKKMAEELEKLEKNYTLKTSMKFIDFTNPKQNKELVVGAIVILTEAFFTSKDYGASGAAFISPKIESGVLGSVVGIDFSVSTETDVDGSYYHIRNIKSVVIEFPLTKVVKLTVHPNYVKVIAPPPSKEFIEPELIDVEFEQRKKNMEISDTKIKFR